nr:hypothetical protein [Tanacetum cinerariifolium]
AKYSSGVGHRRASGAMAVPKSAAPACCPVRGVAASRLRLFSVAGNWREGRTASRLAGRRVAASGKKWPRRVAVAAATGAALGSFGSLALPGRLLSEGRNRLSGRFKRVRCSGASAGPAGSRAARPRWGLAARGGQCARCSARGRPPALAATGNAGAAAEVAANRPGLGGPPAPPAVASRVRQSIAQALATAGPVGRWRFRN